MKGTVMTDPKAMTLTKARIMDEIQNKLSFSRKRSVEVVETLLEIMKRSMENGEDVLISGFGKFCVKQKKERKGRNPATGANLMLAPRRVVTFKCSGKLRDKVNASKSGR
jgi:integration host factor subunit alpha